MQSGQGGPRIVPALPAAGKAKADAKSDNKSEDGAEAKPEAAEKTDRDGTAEVVSLDAFRKKN